MRTQSLTRILCAAVLCIVFNIPTAQAQNSIGINFTGGAQTLAPSAQPGIAPGANWNNVIGASGTGVTLNDNTGAPTAALLSYVSAGNNDSDSTPNTPNAATNTLYSGGLYGDPVISAVFSISVSNIPYAKYDVYTFASADTAATNTLSMSDGATAYYFASNGTPDSSATSLLLTTSTDPANPTVGPAPYQLFSDLTGSSFTLTPGGSIHDVVANNVFGIQIVNATPEPGNLALVGGMASAGITLLRRRRN